MTTTGVLVSIAAASFIAVQASAVGASKKIVVPVAGAIAAVMAAFWTLAIGTLSPTPDLWQRLPGDMLMAGAFGGLGAAAFTWAAGDLIAKIAAFKKKYPDR